MAVGTIASFLVFQAFRPALAATPEQFQVSSGVKFKENQEVINTKSQSVKVLEVNLLDPYTKVDLAYPTKGRLATTSSQAGLVHNDQNRVVGAINGTFFETTKKLPMYLISHKNVLINSGIIATGKDQYVNEPIAFGITSAGKAQIDTFNLEFKLAHGGRSYDINGINKIRNYDDLILYTPENEGGYTNSNQYGLEVIFTGASKNKNLGFGDVITGTVHSIRPYGAAETAPIPADGFVLSAHGDKLPILKEMKIGDEVQISIDIDQKWQGSEYMIASGPRLVDNGQVSLSMDPNSSRARERAPRTAIAVDKTMTKVFMVTVDGRQPGYSTGMNLTEFAQYLVKLGAYDALNLDGGGSTTMLARRHGDSMATLINRPSDGYERAVSTTLQAISTAPIGQPASLIAELSSNKVSIDSSLTVNVKGVLDQYYNPLVLDPTKVKLASTLGTFEGNRFKPNKTGQGTITITYAGVTKELPVTVSQPVVVGVDSSPFKDIQTSYKYYPEINYLYSKGIIAGYGDDTYRPNTTLKRVDAALLLGRALKLDTKNVKDVQFKDVPKTYRFYNEIAAITNAGVMSGKEGGSIFDLNAPLTRAEMAVILQRAFTLPSGTDMPFTDVPKASFAYDAISSLYANKITAGYGTTYKPAGTVDRLQYALFLYRAVKYHEAQVNK